MCEKVSCQGDPLLGMHLPMEIIVAFSHLSKKIGEGFSHLVYQ